MNPARGEVALETKEGRFTLCLTLGALAEIEAVLGGGGTFGAREMLAVLRALLRGGGEWRAARDVERLTLEPRATAAAIAACVRAGAA